ncbi:HIT domain-containing protein [Candidatus Woesearchaeota archaeon]|nr:HIT domain-containing protein [Candidatus Woesearchaeota archaeon]
MSCLFCDFISGKRKKHINGFPFKKLRETKNTLTFLSIDFPATEKGHTLVIPKKHFEQLEDVPKNILDSLINEARLASKVLRKTHKGTNILVNNGKSAGQKIMHLHFHIIPRNPGDRIDVEHFRRRKIPLSAFDKLYSRLKKEF